MTIHNHSIFDNSLSARVQHVVFVEVEGRGQEDPKTEPATSKKHHPVFRLIGVLKILGARRMHKHQETRPIS